MGAPARTIRELIAEDVERTLGGIRRQLGFSLDINTVRPWASTRFQPTELDAAAVYDVDDDSAPVARNAVCENRDVRIITELWTTRPTDDMLVRPTLNAMIGDGYRALMADPYRGGKATDTIYGAVGTIIEAGLMGVQMHWLIRYRYRYQDPTQPV